LRSGRIDTRIGSSRCGGYIEVERDRVTIARTLPRAW
jgi:hypothetical protein